MFVQSFSPKRLTHFLRNEAGNFAIIMGLTAFPLVGVTALAVDYSNFERQRSFVQSAVDAAALATSKEYATGAFAAETPTGVEAKLKAYAKDFFNSNLPAGISPEKAVLNASIVSEVKEDSNGIAYEEKSVGIEVDLEYDTFLAKVIDYDQMTTKIISEVAMGNLTVEIALVVDNSGSMSTSTSGGGTRMVKARDTAKSMVDKIFAAGAISNKQNPVSFSLVPFAASVNIGPANATKTWMDNNGWAPIHNENLDWTNYVLDSGETRTADYLTVWNSKKIFQSKKSGQNWKWRSRFDVYSMLGRTWAGCVEMRSWPHSTKDTVQTITTSMTYDQAAAGTNGGSGVNALFVPMFAPSEPTPKYTTNNKGSESNDSYTYTNNYTTDYRNRAGSWFASTSANRLANQNVRQNWIERYQNAYKTISSSKNPDYSCTTKALTELSTNKTAIKTAIDQMAANGNTNVQEGLAWGWRTLSKSEPFTAGRERDDIDNRKYLIVLTDGNNTYGTNSDPNESTYGPWGFAKHDRIEAGLANADLPNLYKGTSVNTYEKKMNAHTLQTCENARAAGITVFAIAFDVPNGSSVKSLLNACAGSGKEADGDEIVAGGAFYYDATGSTLDAAMTSIASQISEMRIKR